MNHLGLFEGIGGFSIAARWMGWETKAWCEWNPFCQQTLKYHFPEAEGFGDITKTDFTPYANTIDILTGGFPCQPFSQAGKRKGKEDERHLWPEMLRAIGEIQPRWIIGENVSGLVNWSGGLVFEEVQTDLEAKGYEVAPFLLPACGKDAPHRRDRVWIIAYSDSNRNRNIERQDREKDGLQEQYREAICAREFIGADTRIITNSKSNGNSGAIREVERENEEQQTRKEQGEGKPTFGNYGNIWDATNTGNKGLQGSEKFRSVRGSRTEQHQQSTGFLCTDWQNFPTQSPLCNGNDGLSSRLDTKAISFSKWRNESIKAGGNAIVPQVAYEIFKAIEKFESQPSLFNDKAA